MASSEGLRPGPVSLTLTKSQMGVSSGAGVTAGMPILLGNAQVPSSGGLNETSYVVSIRLTALEAVNRIAKGNVSVPNGMTTS